MVDQSGCYKAENVIDTVIYRFGDTSSSWMQAGLRSLGFGLNGAIALGVGGAFIWGAVAKSLGQRYEQTRREESVRREI